MKEGMERNLYIWGTGNVCLQLLSSFRELKPVSFIDNDTGKAGLPFAKARIVHPGSIKNWEGLYIILALDNYSSVKAQIEEKGLQEGIDFIWYRDWIFQKKDVEMALENAERFRETCGRESQRYYDKRLLFSDFLSFDKGVCDYVNRWNDREGDLVLLSEAGWIGESIAKAKLAIPVLQLPELYWRNMYFRHGREIPGFQKKALQIREKGYLLEAAVNLRMGYPDMAKGYEYIICCEGEKLIRKLLQCWKPREVILWNAFYAFHFIIRNVCREENVPVRYMEFGNIPGTIIVEDIGQMGESWPAQRPEEFMNIQVEKGEYDRAERMIKQLRESGLNRNVQPHNDMVEKVRKGLMEGRPVVLYAGQNDNASGMQPYTENTQRFHSPIFRTSDEGAIYLAELCKRQGWNFIYKPHPMMYAHSQKQLLPPSAIVVNDVNINELIDISDVVVTILSTVSYIALIRETPVVMLGYTQLRGKRCTYEAFERKDIEGRLRMALESRFSEGMKNYFLIHLGQLNRYYNI